MNLLSVDEEISGGASRKAASRRGMVFLSVAILCAVAACGQRASLESAWGIPAVEREGAPLSQNVVLIADNQFRYLYGDPVWLSSGLVNQFVSVAIRSVQLDFYAPDLLRWIVEEFGAQYPLIHLGDALDLACTSEFETFVATMRGARHGWVMAPGNHDAFYFGNGHFSWSDWQRACETADGRGRPMTKSRFVEAYLAQLDRQMELGLSARGDMQASGSWILPPNTSSFLKAVVWKRDQRRPWRSFVVQRLDLSLDGSTRPVEAILLDTTQYALRPGLLPIYPFRNAGVTGQMLGNQIETVERWLAERKPGQVIILMGHHPYSSLARGARRAIDRWRREARVAMYVSAHTHTAQYFVHAAGDTPWLELNVGSTTDWPPEARTLQVSEVRGDPGRIAFRMQRYPLNVESERRQAELGVTTHGCLKHA